MTDNRRLPTYLFALLAIAFLAGGIYALNDISLYTPDSTRYLVWARSLATFAGYADRTLPEPVRYVVHAPMYAFLLVPAAALWPGSILAAKACTLCLGVLLLWLSFRWYARVMGEGMGLLGCAMLAVSPLTFLFSTEVLSDVPFAAALVLSWILLEKLTAEERFDPWLVFGTSVSVAVALLLREIGIAILISSVAYLLLRKRYKEALVVFLVPALVYGAWYVRNELIVAPLEDPPLTNARILTYHFMTPRDATLVSEFLARAGANLTVYGAQLRDLLFAPVYFSRQYDVIPASEPLLGAMTAILGVLRIPLTIVGLGSVLAGLWLDGRTSSAARLRIAFLVVYAGVALSYPINDIRFLLPVLVLSVFYCLVAWSAAAAHWPRVARLVPAVVLVLLLPNLAWEFLYARTSATFERDPAGFARSAAGAVPTHFTKPFRPVGEWIGAHTDSTAVILTQWKDLAVWAGDRKVMNVDQTLSLDEFENTLRDYEVTLLVSQRKRSGITEFAIPMHQSRSYGFELAQRIGSTEIYRVTAKPAGEARAESTAFERSLTFLERGEVASAESTLASMWNENSQNVAALYVLATAKGIAEKGSEADSLFSLLRSFPQAGMYVGRASQQQLLRSVLRARGTTGSGRASLLAGAAAGYWNAGWRTRARELADAALLADLSEGTAIIFSFHFALKEDDVTTARGIAERVATAFPQHPLLPVLTSMLALRDSLGLPIDAPRRASLLGRLAAVYARLGLSEDAITAGRASIDAGTDDPSTALLVVDLYLAKKRFAPARSTLERLLAVHPTDRALLERHGRLPER